jgi:hypothetical protein
LVEYSEPEWCEADRLAVLAELERRRMQGSHGQPMDEATDPRANPSSRSAEWSYVAEPFIDFAQQALDQAADAYRKRYGDDVPDGLRWSVKRVAR